jgi:hypothetical protein
MNASEIKKREAKVFLITSQLDDIDEAFKDPNMHANDKDNLTYEKSQLEC